MFGKIFVGAAVWLASSPTGRKTARRGFRVLNRLGGKIVNALPSGMSGVLNGVDDFVKDVAQDAPQTEGGEAHA